MTRMVHDPHCGDLKELLCQVRVLDSFGTRNSRKSKCVLFWSDEFKSQLLEPYSMSHTIFCLRRRRVGPERSIEKAPSSFQSLVDVIAQSAKPARVALGSHEA